MLWSLLHKVNQESETKDIKCNTVQLKSTFASSGTVTFTVGYSAKTDVPALAEYCTLCTQARRTHMMFQHKLQELHRAWTKQLACSKQSKLGHIHVDNRALRVTCPQTTYFWQQTFWQEQAYTPGTTLQHELSTMQMQSMYRTFLSVISSQTCQLDCITTWIVWNSQELQFDWMQQLELALCLSQLLCRHVPQPACQFCIPCCGIGLCHFAVCQICAWLTIKLKSSWCIYWCCCVLWTGRQAYSDRHKAMHSLRAHLKTVGGRWLLHTAR